MVIEQGADSYIEKPFTPQYLQVRVRKLLDSRKKLQEYFSKTLHFPEKENDMTGSFDKRFLDKVEKVLQNNHTRSDFSVEEFGQLVGLSRIHLYRKIKALTGFTPSEFVNKYRLHRAVQKLKTMRITFQVSRWRLDSLRQLIFPNVSRWRIWL